MENEKGHYYVRPIVTGRSHTQNDSFVAYLHKPNTIIEVDQSSAMTKFYFSTIDNPGHEKRQFALPKIYEYVNDNCMMPGNYRILADVLFGKLPSQIVTDKVFFGHTRMLYIFRGWE